jgi:hypothetical protein
MKRCLTSLAIRELKIKTKIKNHLTPTRMAKIKSQIRPVTVEHVCNPSYSESGDQKDHVSSPAQSKKLVISHLKSKLNVVVCAYGPAY